MVIDFPRVISKFLGDADGAPNVFGLYLARPLIKQLDEDGNCSYLVRPNNAEEGRFSNSAVMYAWGPRLMREISLRSQRPWSKSQKEKRPGRTRCPNTRGRRGFLSERGKVQVKDENELIGTFTSVHSIDLIQKSQDASTVMQDEIIAVCTAYNMAFRYIVRKPDVGSRCISLTGRTTDTRQSAV